MYFSWVDATNFGSGNTIFVDGGTVDVRIGNEVENVVTIAADSATLDLTGEGLSAGFTLTRTGSLANWLPVKLNYTEAGRAGCGWFAAGESSGPLYHYAVGASHNDTISFTVEPYAEGEWCDSLELEYHRPYRVGSPNSATVTVVNE